MGPFRLVFFRVVFATISLIFFFLITKRKFDLKPWRIYAVIGFFNVAIPFALISWSEKHISSGLASILNSTVPLFTMLIAAILVEGEQLTPKRIFGMLIGFTGVYVLMSNNLGEGTEKLALGIGAMLLAVCSYSFSSVYARRTSHHVTPQGQSLGQMATAVFFIAPAMLIIESPFQFPILGKTYLALAWLGILGSCVAPLLWFALIHEIGPSRTNMVSYIFPLVGVVLGVIFLKESLDWRLFVGGALVLFGIIVVNTRKEFFRRSHQPVNVNEGSPHE